MTGVENQIERGKRIRQEKTGDVWSQIALWKRIVRWCARILGASYIYLGIQLHPLVQEEPLQIRAIAILTVLLGIVMIAISRRSLDRVFAASDGNAAGKELEDMHLVENHVKKSEITQDVAPEWLTHPAELILVREDNEPRKLTYVVNGDIACQMVQGQRDWITVRQEQIDIAVPALEAGIQLTAKPGERLTVYLRQAEVRTVERHSLNHTAPASAGTTENENEEQKAGT